MISKAIKIYEQGSLDVLKIEEVNLKDLGSNEILIEHSFAGLNFIDINQRRGTYPLKNLPAVLGMEASGTVREIGSNVTKFNIGDKVTHCMNLGSFSQFMNLDQDKTIKLKKEVDLKISIMLDLILKISSFSKAYEPLVTVAIPTFRSSEISLCFLPCKSI